MGLAGSYSTDATADFGAAPVGYVR